MNQHEAIITENKDDITEKELESILDQAYEGRINNIEASFEKIKWVLAISQKSNLYYIEAKSHNYLGLLFMIRGDHEKSITHSQKALSYFQKVNNPKAIADAKYNIASSLYKSDNFHEGLKGLLECRKIYKSFNETQSETKVLKSIATIYEYFGDIEKAYDTYQECIELSIEINDLAMLSNAYNPLSGIYIKRGELEKALEISDKSFQIKKKIKDERGKAFSIYGIGKVYLAQKKYPSAKKEFIKSLNLQRKFGDKLGEGMALNKLGLTYLGLGHFKNSEKTLLYALEFAKTNNIKLIEYKANNSLYLLYKSKKKWEKSLKNLESYISSKEKAINSRTFDMIKSYEATNEIERLEKESKLQKDYFEVIEKKNQELDSFFYRVSHDLKGPITSLMGLNSLVQHEKFDNNAMQYFQMYHRQFTRMYTIIMDLINITRMNSNQSTFTKINFKELIDECINSYTYFENFEKIKFKVEIQKNLKFESEWVIINTILQNLIENAVKYIRHDITPHISIKVYKTPEFLEIEVKDNGQGIPSKYQNKVFDMFFRANDNSEGSGLGLYILKRAVERLHGNVSLHSTVGEGSTFIVQLKY